MKGPARTLTATFGETARSGGRLVADRFCELTGERGIETAVVLRAVEGFGSTHALRTERFVDTAVDLPLVAVAAGDPAGVEALAGDLGPLLESGLIVVSAAAPPTGELRLTAVLGRRRRGPGGRPAFVEAVEILRAAGVSGATVLSGVDGVVEGLRRRARFLSANVDVPLLVVAVGREDEVRPAAAALGKVFGDLPLVLEPVGIFRQEDDAAAAFAEGGGSLWSRIDVYLSAQAHHEGRPLGFELVRRLRGTGGGGATLVRGIWGFSADHPPHGESVRSLRRRTPLVATVVVPPRELAGVSRVVEELTRKTGLVTSEPVRAVVPRGQARAARGRR